MDSIGQSISDRVSSCCRVFSVFLSPDCPISCFRVFRCSCFPVSLIPCSPVSLFFGYGRTHLPHPSPENSGTPENRKTGKQGYDQCSPPPLNPVVVIPHILNVGFLFSWATMKCDWIKIFPSSPSSTTTSLYFTSHCSPILRNQKSILQHLHSTCRISNGDLIQINIYIGLCAICILPIITTISITFNLRSTRDCTLSFYLPLHYHPGKYQMDPILSCSWFKN